MVDNRNAYKVPADVPSEKKK